MRKTKVIRVPTEFDMWIDNMSNETSRQTGYPKNKQATIKRLTDWGNGTIIPKGFGFDVALFGRRRKRI